MSGTFLTWCPGCSDELEPGWISTCPYCEDEYCKDCIKDHKEECVENPKNDES